MYDCYVFSGTFCKCDVQYYQSQIPMELLELEKLHCQANFIRSAITATIEYNGKNDAHKEFKLLVDKYFSNPDESIKVYNFEVENCHTYFVGSGVWVHNTCDFTGDMQAVIDLAKEYKSMG